MKRIAILLGLGLVVWSPSAQAQGQVPGPGQGQGQQIESIPTEAFIDWTVHNDSGWSCLYKGDLHMAEQHFAAAIAVVKPHYKTDPRLLARSYGDLAWVLYQQGRVQEALPLAEWALQAKESRLPAYSEAIAQSLSILGTIEGAAGKLDKAETHLARSLAIVQSRDGTESSRVAEALFDLAKVQASRRKFTPAATAFRRILAMPSTILAGNDPVRVNSYLRLGEIEETQGNDAEALDLLRKADIAYPSLSPPDPEGRTRLQARIKAIEERLAREKRPLEKSKQAE